MDEKILEQFDVVNTMKSFYNINDIVDYLKSDENFQIVYNFLETKQLETSVSVLLRAMDRFLVLNNNVSTVLKLAVDTDEEWLYENYSDFAHAIKIVKQRPEALECMEILLQKKVPINDEVFKMVDTFGILDAEKIANGYYKSNAFRLSLRFGNSSKVGILFLKK